MEALLSLVGFAAIVAGIIGLMATHSLFSSSLLVIAGQVLAAALMLWARLTFGLRSFHLTATPTEGGLVTTGPYRLVRHPIYASASLFVLVSALGHPSLRTAALACLVIVGVVIRAVTEEKLVARQYPAYRDYAKRTKRLIPYVY